MEIRTFKDNELVTGISILAVLKYSYELELSKCLLIEPLLSYSKVVKALKRANSGIRSIEELVLKENVVFAGFNTRYQEHLLLSINGMMLFSEMGLISIEGNKAIYTGDSFNLFNSTLGNKTRDRVKAAKKVSEILQKGDASDLYLCLRVEI